MLLLAITRIDMDDYNWRGGLWLVIVVHLLLIFTLGVILLVVPAWRRRRRNKRDKS